MTDDGAQNGGDANTARFFDELNACIACHNVSDWLGVYRHSSVCFDNADGETAKQIDTAVLTRLVNAALGVTRDREIRDLAVAAITPERDTRMRARVNEAIALHNQGRLSGLPALIEDIASRFGILLCAESSRDVAQAFWNVAKQHWDDPRLAWLEGMVNLAGVVTRPTRTFREDNKRRLYPELGCAFVHIPRTAGHSIAAHLFKEAQSRPLPDRWAARESDLGKLEMHSTAVQIRDVLGEEDWRALFSFSVVRNPWDYMLSTYRYSMQYAPKLGDYFVKIADEVEKLDGFGGYMRSDWGRSRTLHMSANMDGWYMDGEKQIVDHVMRLEDMETEWPAIVERLGLSKSALTLPRKGETEAVEGRHEAYDAETREIVRERFRAVIERFGYEF